MRGAIAVLASSSLEDEFRGRRGVVSVAEYVRLVVGAELL